MEYKIKYRLMKLLHRLSPVRRHILTRRALGQFKKKMPWLKDVLQQLEDEGFIEIYQIIDPTSKGRTPDIYALTLAGKKWVMTEIRKHKKAIKGVR